MKDKILLGITNMLKRFYMDNLHQLHTLMVVRYLEVVKDPFRPQEKNEELLGPEVSYLSVVRAIIIVHYLI